jgi:MFS family permease
LRAEPPGHRAAIATATLFFVNGASTSNWLPRIPEVRDELGLSNSGLGVALLGGGLGGLAGSLFVGALMGRLGSRRLVLRAAPALALCLPLIGFVPNAAALMAVLTLIGVLDVLNDMAMNAQGVIAQERLGRAIMNRLHGAWSLGFVAGAFIGLVASATHLDIRWHLTMVAAVLLVTLWFVRDRLIVDEPAHVTSAEANETRAGRSPARSAVVIAVAFMAAGVIQFEVLPTDWSAVMLRDVFDAGRLSGSGTVVFAAAMLVGRLVGDHAIERFGQRRLLSAALVITAAGMVVVATAQAAPVALVGFGTWGLGTSVLFPQLYALAATLPGLTAGAGLGAMAFGQRGGFLLNPVCVGALADARGIRSAYAVVAAVAMGLVLVCRRCLRRIGTAQPSKSSQIPTQ